VIFDHFRRGVEYRCQLRAGNLGLGLNGGKNTVVQGNVRSIGYFDFVQGLQDDYQYEFDEDSTASLGIKGCKDPVIFFLMTGDHAFLREVAE
jgi:hypothetical protein